MAMEGVEKFHAVYEYGATIVCDPVAVTDLVAKGFGIMTLRDPAFVSKVLAKTSRKKKRKQGNRDSFGTPNHAAIIAFGSPAMEENNGIADNDINPEVEKADGSNLEGKEEEEVEEETEVDPEEEDEEEEGVDDAVDSDGDEDDDGIMDEDDVEPDAEETNDNDHEEDLPTVEPIIPFDEEIPLVAATVDENAVVISPIVLLSEEAYYLASNGLLSISIASKPNKPLSLDELWTLFYQLNPSFPIYYFVYNHFRAEKWVIRHGFNYGMDYCFYRDLPGIVHSELCVRIIDSISKPTIIRADSQSNQYDMAYRQSNCAWKIVQEEKSTISWRNLSTITRIMPDVMKLGLLCYVVPKDDSKVSEGINAAATNGGFKYGHLFDINEENSSSQSTASAAATDDVKQSIIDFSTSACLNQLMLRPVTLITRRHCIGSSKEYPTVTSLQRKFRHSKGSRNPHSGGDKKKKVKTPKKSPQNDRQAVSTVVPPIQDQGQEQSQEPSVTIPLEEGSFVPVLAAETSSPQAEEVKAADESSARMSGKKRTADEISSKVLQKKSRKRRDIDEVRTKKSKNQTIWHVLAADSD